MSDDKRWGAEVKEWLHWDVLLGLGADLLPVVSRPLSAGSRVSASSKLKALGKVPSRYNRGGEIVGLAGWTDRRSSEPQTQSWSNVPDYGICLQTRTVRALDVDVGDPAKVERIMGVIHTHLPGAPVRTRSDSSKVLLLFEVSTAAGGLRKRSMKVDGGIIEMLATGQQCIVGGTHPGGARYEWLGGLPLKWPVVSVEALDALWNELAGTFAVEAPVSAHARKKGAGDGGVVRDERRIAEDWISGRLSAAGLVLDWGREGQAYVECPWKDGHSMDSGESETAYFPAGTGGYEMGHFKCLHASCGARGDADFMDVLGLRASGFDVVGEGGGPGGDGGGVFEGYGTGKYLKKTGVEGGDESQVQVAGKSAGSAGGAGEAAGGVVHEVQGELSEPWPAVARRKDGGIKSVIGAVRVFAARSDILGEILARDVCQDALMSLLTLDEKDNDDGMEQSRLEKI